MIICNLPKNSDKEGRVQRSQAKEPRIIVLMAFPGVLTLRRDWFGRTAALKGRFSITVFRWERWVPFVKDSVSPSEAGLPELRCKLDSPGEI